MVRKRRCDPVWRATSVVQRCSKKDPLQFPSLQGREVRHSLILTPHDAGWECWNQQSVRHPSRLWKTAFATSVGQATTRIPMGLTQRALGACAEPWLVRP